MPKEFALTAIFWQKVGVLILSQRFFFYGEITYALNYILIFTVTPIAIYVSNRTDFVPS